MIQESYKIFEGVPVELDWTVSVAGMWYVAMLKFDDPPASPTAGDVQVIFKSGNGSEYDTVLLEGKVPTLATDKKDIYLTLNIEVPINSGDKITVAYANPDDRTIAVTIKGTNSSRY